MTMQISFSKYEQALRREYRRIINSAESTEDVKKFFVRTVSELFEKALGQKVEFDYDDLSLNPDRKEGFMVGKSIKTIPGFLSAWKESDLPEIVKRPAKE